VNLATNNSHAWPAATHPTGRRPIPIWIPDPADPDGVDGTWEVVDPDAPGLDPQRAAQASAIAAMWAA
jgi:hypothetical protein